jgi:hypothetical protein
LLTSSNKLVSIVSGLPSTSSILAASITKEIRSNVR